MSDALTARFTKRFAGGATISAVLAPPARGHAVTVLFGPSGCGKTTVLRSVAGLERPDEGTIRFGEELWFDGGTGFCLPPQQRRIGFVSQDYALFPHLSVAGNVGYGLSRLPSAERRRRLGEAIERFGLRGLEDRPPRELSGGQQQRVALARALACRPRLLLLDEPLSALDAVLRDQLRGELRRSLAECEVPVLLVTHDREEVVALGDELVVMSEGKVLQSGSVLEVLNRPADVEVARIVRVETVQPGRVASVRDGLATVEVGRTRIVALAPTEDVREVFVCIRGEDVILERGQGVASSVRNRLDARVVRVEVGSPLTRVELDVGFPLFAFITRPACEELALEEGIPVSALIKAPAVHLVARAGEE